ncbi:hypothetical protein ACFQ78_19615 [Streptomyces sp. NPDC056519]|uniref:hypothetical protein n=1 Tax=Streptomyces sp. NPDC056519 TaxID=3345849 RepID=UPI00367AE91F
MAGCFPLALSVPDAAAGFVAGRVAENARANVLHCIAVGAISVGMVLVVRAHALALYVTGFAVRGLGTGLTGVLTTVLVQQRVAPGKAGAAAGLSLAAKVLAWAVALALAATWVEAVNGGSRGAGANGRAVETVLGATAALVAPGSWSCCHGRCGPFGQPDAVRSPACPDAPPDALIGSASDFGCPQD